MNQVVFPKENHWSLLFHPNIYIWVFNSILLHMNFEVSLEFLVLPLEVSHLLVGALTRSKEEKLGVSKTEDLSSIVI